MAAENWEPPSMVSQLEAASGGRVVSPKAEIGRLRPETAERGRGMAKYESPHASPSSGSLYNERRTAFQKKMA